VKRIEGDIRELGEAENAGCYRAGLGKKGSSISFAKDHGAIHGDPTLCPEPPTPLHSGKLTRRKPNSNELSSHRVFGCAFVHLEMQGKWVLRPASRETGSNNHQSRGI
jgi:hypothetical protein